MVSIVATHVLILSLAVFSRTLKQEQKGISSRPALHDCRRDRGGGREGGREGRREGGREGGVTGLLAMWLVSLL